MIDPGVRINAWTYLGPSKRNKRYGVFQCECGEIKDVFISSVINGTSKSCKHCAWNRFGLTKDDYYSIIYARRRAINRCYNSNYEQYHRYGGRGITVCSEWLENQDAFVKWAVDNGWEKGLSLDRIDNDGAYSPGNCRWATNKQQARNKSSCIYLKHNGETKTMIEWCELFGVPHWLANNRWSRGERNFDALFSPIDRQTGVTLYYRP